MSSPTALLPPGEPGDNDDTDRELTDDPTTRSSHEQSAPDKGTIAGSIALGNILLDPDAAPDAGQEIHISGRAARGDSGEVRVLLPPRFEDADGQPRDVAELELDGPSFFLIRTPDPVEQPLRIRLRRRGLPGPSGARGDILLDVRPDDSLPIQRGPDRPPATRVSFAVVAVAKMLVLALVIWRTCGG